MKQLRRFRFRSISPASWGTIAPDSRSTLTATSWSLGPDGRWEWMDEIVFLEGFAAALELHLESAPLSATEGHAVQRAETLEPLQNTALSNFVQSGATVFMVAAEGFEPPTPRV